ncbi:MAG: acetyl-CoA C-acyltransferase, partial [Clostridiales bacterium]|nr:acetyl-CoA C-acyltransferase [Clostridiales bacterium]MDD6611533.1 acetyl-CoA C-acyltransferase [Clostridiales bacterium]
MNVYICSAKRTPIGSYGKSLKDVSAKDLGITAAKAAIAQAGIDVNDIDETLTGCVLQGGNGQNIGRQIAVGA